MAPFPSARKRRVGLFAACRPAVVPALGQAERREPCQPQRTAAVARHSLPDPDHPRTSRVGMVRPAQVRVAVTIPTQPPASCEAHQATPGHAARAGALVPRSAAITPARAAPGFVLKQHQAPPPRTPGLDRADLLRDVTATRHAPKPPPSLRYLSRSQTPSLPIHRNMARYAGGLSDFFRSEHWVRTEKNHSLL